MATVLAEDQALGLEVRYVGGMLIQQTRAEFTRFWRTPMFSIFSLVLPTLFFALFGLTNMRGSLGGTAAGPYLLASFGTYSVISVMLFSFGVGVAAERGQGLDVLIRTTPLQPVVHLLARTITAVAFAVLAVALLFAFGALVGGIRMAPTAWLSLGGSLLVGCLPFIALGYAIGYLAGPAAASAAVNLIFLPLAFASGLFMPLQYLPDFVQRLAPVLPTYRFAQLSWAAVGARTDPVLVNLAWLLAYGVVFFLLALRAYRLDESRKFA
jgi:ABC-2 type transport system permease protein